MRSRVRARRVPTLTHAYTPSTATAAVWSDPQETVTRTSSARSPTTLGTHEPVVLTPSPSCPSFPAPQVYSVPCRLMQILRQGDGKREDASRWRWVQQAAGRRKRAGGVALLYTPRGLCAIKALAAGGKGGRKG